jgi:hypothetical protein
MASPDDASELPEETSGDELTTAERLAVVRAVEVLFQKWELTDVEKRTLLGTENDDNLEVWHADNIGALPHKTLTRLTDFIRIHRALRNVFHDPTQCYAWVKRPNHVFSGQSALQVMLRESATGVVRVRSYLEAEVDG